MNSGNAIVYSTRSLYAASFLLAVGFPLVGLRPDHNGRVSFDFGGDSAALTAELAAYRNGAALVNAQRFASEIRRLKVLVHGGE